MARTMVLFLLIAVSTHAGWTETQLATDAHLNGLSILSSEEVWVAGQNGTIFHFTGGIWSPVTTPTTKQLKAIAMLSPTEGWAAGSEGVILRCQAGVWTELPPVDDQISYEDILAFDSSNVYIIGYGFLPGGKVMHWDGTQITEVFQIAGNLQEIAASGPDNIWIVGSQNLRVHYNGTTWTQDTSNLPEACNLWGVAIDENGYPIICGNRLPDWDKCYILTDTGSGWTTLYCNYEPWMLAIDVEETRGFAAGKDGRLIEQTIFGWQRITSPSTRQINEIKMAGMAQGFAVCNDGRILEYREPSVDVVLNQRLYRANDAFNATCVITNPGAQRTVDLFILLDVYGTFFFWPAFSSEVSFETQTMAAQDQYELAILPEFAWPTGVGSADGIVFWGALIEQGNLLAYDTETFGWE